MRYFLDVIGIARQSKTVWAEDKADYDVGHDDRLLGVEKQRSQRGCSNNNHA